MMRVCWISTLLLGLFHAALLPSSSGLEGGKKIGIDDVYKPRKWSQLRDGPYRMVVSSRDQESNETQPDSRKATRNRQNYENYKQEKEVKSEAIADSPDKAEDPGDSIPEPSTDTEDSKIASRPVDKETDDIVVHKPRVDRRKHKVKFDQNYSSPATFDNFEKSTQRTVTKLTRKRERILGNENFRKAHRISLSETHYSTANPSTISHKLYNHFRPIDRGIPRESIIPFFDFGKKLSTGKPPNAINSIEGSSTPGLGAFEITTHREDEDLYHEDMDVSVVKHKPVEWNSPPRARPPAKNPELISYFRTNPNRKTEENAVRPTSPDTIKEDVITTTMPGETSYSDEPTVTIPTTMLPPEKVMQDVRRNESKPYTFSPKQPINKDVISKKNEKPHLAELNTADLTQLPRPSPTAKILSTAVVTSVSVKETYKHPRMKGLNLDVEEIIVNPPYNAESKSQALKYLEINNVTAEGTPDSQKNQTNRVDKSLSVIVPSTHRPSLDRVLVNKTSVNLKTNSTIQPTTIRPKFRSNIEYHTFATKVPTTSTTHKPVNRSLYSTSQREHQKNKFISHQHSRLDHMNKTLSFNQTFEETTQKAESQPSSLHENRTKMYLTIRSRIPNQAAIYRNTFKRNGTKPLSPVLRVIATPSSYIEVPKIISRQNASTTRNPTETDVPETIVKNHASPSSDNISPNSDTSDVTTGKYYISPSHAPNSEASSKTIDSTRETRMNNHRMPQEEPTTVQESGAELTTEVIFHSLDTTEAQPEISSSRTRNSPSEEPISIVTVGPRLGTIKPKLPWVYLGHKNRTRLNDSPSVQAAQWSGFGIAAYVLAALGIIPLILGGFILLRQIFIKGKKKMLDESEYSSEYNRTPLPTKLPRITSHIVNWEGEKSTSNLGSSQQSSGTLNGQHQTTQHQSNHHQPTQHQSSHHQNSQQMAQLLHQTSQNTPSLYLIAPGKWEFPRDKLRLQTLLGEGNFGQVWKAEADDISGHEGLTRLVAVKTVKEGSGGREREDLLRELAIMKELGSHPNVVTLLGCCTDREPFLLIMEYVMYGKMLTFLREHRTRAHYFNFSDLNSALVSRDLTVFAYCVARGMEFLVSKGIIHRDLAARNILVDHNKLCKIADFGMSRNVRDTGEIYEQRPNRGALPIRWMAPEALHCSVFTHKSDVWSFGILVWEIITLGCTPYQTMGAREVMRRVREGYRLERPVHCSQELYKVITRCWAGDASKRPTFTELKHDLATLLSDPQTNGACVDLDALTEEMSSHSC